MKCILIILFLVPSLSFADSIMCGGGAKQGGYGCTGEYRRHNNNNKGVETFICSGTQKELLFSFNYCYVILDSTNY